MKKQLSLFFSLLVLACSLASCSEGETYGDKKEKERNAIDDFLRDSAFNVIDEATFVNQGQQTFADRRQFVYLDRKGVYMQIVRPGCGDYIADGEQVNVLCKYTEYNILSKSFLSSNISLHRYYDKMLVSRTNATYTASFTFGVMYSTYGASVPAGWLAPLPYIKVGRQTSEDAEIARVRLIVPHTQGHASASSSVYPCFYDITYQRER